VASDYPSYWTDTRVLKAIHYVLLPLVGAARVIRRLGGRIRVANVYAGPDGAKRYIGVWRLNLRSLAVRFCDHDWRARTADDDKTYTWFDEFEGICHVTDACKICGAERPRSWGVGNPSLEALALLRGTLRKEFPALYQRYVELGMSSGWYVEFPVAISRILRDKTEDDARARIREAASAWGPTGRTF
jgi:hypothetical protein